MALNIPGQEQPPIRILGVDPGTATTGYGVIEVIENRFKILDYGCIQTDAQELFPFRLKRIYDEICQIIQQYHPHSLAMEDVFFHQNVKMALKMGQARGVTLLAAVNFNIPTSEYSPREVKQAVTGNGGASKVQVQKMVKELLNLKEVPTPYDVADALAVALCHCNRIVKGL